MKFLRRLMNIHRCTECSTRAFFPVLHWQHCIWCWVHGCGDCTCDYPYRWPARRR